VDYVENKPKNGSKVTITNNQQMVMPVLMKVEERNGKTHEFKVPVEIWKKGQEAQFKVNTTSKIKHITIDAEHQVPDIDRSNNEWKK
jgi:hypothetical protein